MQLTVTSSCVYTARFLQWLRRSHITQYRWVPLRVQRGYYDATVTKATTHPVAAEYPHSSINGTPTCSSHIGTALYDNHVAGQEESGCVGFSWYPTAMVYIYNIGLHLLLLPLWLPP